MACSAVSAATLHVRFDQLHAMRGHLLVNVCAHANDYRRHGNAMLQDRVALRGPAGPVEHDIALPPGRYAVEAQQDVNDNGKLDFTLLHIPNEPVECSRNPHVRRRPHFDECAFTLPVEGDSISILMN